jgi:hypothetical protein
MCGVRMQRQLAYRVTNPDKITWQGLRAAWCDEPFFSCIGERTAEILFLRHITKLQMDTAARRKVQAGEVRPRLRYLLPT